MMTPNEEISGAYRAQRGIIPNLIRAECCALKKTWITVNNHTVIQVFLL